MSEGSKTDNGVQLDSSRRDLLLRSLGVLGGAALLKGCAPTDAPTMNQLGAAGAGEVAVTAQALLGYTLVWFDTYADLRTRYGVWNLQTAPNIAIGRDPVSGGVFTWTQDTTSADDGGTIIVPTNTARTGAWKRIFSGPVNVKWFGAKGDETLYQNLTPTARAALVAAETAAVLAAVTYCYNNGHELFFPSGRYRVTDLFTTTGDYRFIRWTGEGWNRDWVPYSTPSELVLESSDPDAKILKVINYGTTTVIRNLQFSCAQPAASGYRKLIDLRENCSIQLSSVDFEDCDTYSIYFNVHCYFQNASFRDVQFRNSGMFGSAGNALKGTLLVLDNVNHEGSVPANNDKVVCDLSGIRNISATNLNLEGALPSAGWRILRLWADNAVTSPTIGGSVGGSFANVWSEWAGAFQPLYDISVTGMTATFQSPYFQTSEIDKSSMLLLDGHNGQGAPVEPSSFFTFLDAYSKVISRGGIYRSICDVPASPQLTLENCYQIRSSEEAVAVVLSPRNKGLVYTWNGELPRDSSLVTWPAAISYGCRRTIITDATYGRLINWNRNGQTYPCFGLAVQATPAMANQPLSLVMHANWPVATGGTYLYMYALWQFDDGTTVDSTIAPITVGAFGWQRFTVRVPPRGIKVQYHVSSNSSGNANSDLQIAALQVQYGEDVDKFPMWSHPATTVSHDTAPPTTGSWAVGDRVVNAAPSVGSPKAWICTASGSPGVWVSEGNL